jgi:hypothetical protein
MASFLSHTFHLTSRGRLKPKQASGFYPNKYGFPSSGWSSSRRERRNNKDRGKIFDKETLVPDGP